jgi:outer membrane immunogenic protein
MKRLILVFGAALLASIVTSTSFAGEMAGRYYAPVPAPPSLFGWSGLYFGLNGGYGWGRSDWTSSVTTGSTNPSGGLFGGTIGFNGQSGAFVFGLEGDIDASWIRDSNRSGTGVNAKTNSSSCRLTSTKI